MFDFSGTGPEVFGNLNAPRAITLSALIYCLRCLVGRDIPLNQVCRRVPRVRSAGRPQAQVTLSKPGAKPAQQPNSRLRIPEVLRGWLGHRSPH